MKLVLIAFLIASLNPDLIQGQVFGPSKHTKDKVNPFHRGPKSFVIPKMKLAFKALIGN